MTWGACMAHCKLHALIPMPAGRQEVEAIGEMLHAHLGIYAREAREGYIEAKGEGQLKAAIAWRVWFQWEPYALFRVANAEQALYEAGFLDDGEEKDATVAALEAALAEERLLVPDETAGDPEEEEAAAGDEEPPAEE